MLNRGCVERLIATRGFVWVSTRLYDDASKMSQRDECGEAGAVREFAFIGF